jgi:hypothetical protein
VDVAQGGAGWWLVVAVTTKSDLRCGDLEGGHDEDTSGDRGVREHIMIS